MSIRDHHIVVFDIPRLDAEIRAGLDRARKLARPTCAECVMCDGVGCGRCDNTGCLDIDTALKYVRKMYHCGTAPSTAAGKRRLRRANKTESKAKRLFNKGW